MDHRNPTKLELSVPLRRVIAVLLMVAAFVVLVRWRLGWCGPSPREQDSGVSPIRTALTRSCNSVLDSPADATTNDSHSLAISALAARANANEQLTPADIQSLLAFISAPKPGDLTDGEWEERVNGILNLLRRQTEDFETEDRRQDGASSLAGSSARSAVPGLAEVLLEMAEKHPSKVLRLYAMQHLSLWFGKERDPAKRRAMVGLLEKLATTPGDETAGCAVLMLADMSRQVSSVQFQVSSGEGGAGGGPQGQPHQPSATSSATSASPRFASPNHGIDWARVDGILETASRRLVGEAGAGADVRISAIHACVDRKDAGSLPELRKIAENTALVSTLRKAAIHAIDQLGTAEDAALLESLPQADGNLSMAVQPARKALAKRNAADPPSNRQ